MDKLPAIDPSAGNWQSPVVKAAPQATVEAAQPAGYEADARAATAGPAAPTEVSGKPATLTDAQVQQIAVKKATCPFIGSGVASHALPVRNSAAKPLASIDDVVALGNSGGGDLGKVLEVFAKGNHNRMVGPDGKLDEKVPTGLFSLDFPGSQGSHPGHSGILQGDPTRLDSGRLSPPDLDRLLSRAKDGYLKRSDIAKFMAENLARDPNSKVADTNVAKRLFGDAGGTIASAGPAFVQKLKGHVGGQPDNDVERQFAVALTKTLGEDNLVGTSGEFGLLMAFLMHSPRTKTIGGEPALAVSDVKSMFADHQFPPGWETWPKTSRDWVVNTTALLVDTAKAYHGLKRGGR